MNRIIRPLKSYNRLFLMLWLLGGFFALSMLLPGPKVQAQSPIGCDRDGSFIKEWNANGYIYRAYQLNVSGSSTSAYGSYYQSDQSNCTGDFTGGSLGTTGQPNIPGRVYGDSILLGRPEGSRYSPPDQMELGIPGHGGWSWWWGFAQSSCTQQPPYHNPPEMWCLNWPTDGNASFAAYVDDGGAMQIGGRTIWCEGITLGFASCPPNIVTNGNPPGSDNGAGYMFREDRCNAMFLGAVNCAPYASWYSPFIGNNYNLTGFTSKDAANDINYFDPVFSGVNTNPGGFSSASVFTFRYTSNNASCVAATSNLNNVAAGTPLTISITLNNTGTRTWWNFRGHQLDYSGVANGSVSIPGNGLVFSGNTVTFTLPTTMPASSGSINFRMDQSGIGQFGTSCSVQLSPSIVTVNCSLRIIPAGGIQLGNVFQVEATITNTTPGGTGSPDTFDNRRAYDISSSGPVAPTYITGPRLAGTQVLAAGGGAEIITWNLAIQNRNGAGSYTFDVNPVNPPGWQPANNSPNCPSRSVNITQPAPVVACTNAIFNGAQTVGSRVTVTATIENHTPPYGPLIDPSTGYLLRIRVIDPNGNLVYNESPVTYNPTGAAFDWSGSGPYPQAFGTTRAATPITLAIAGNYRILVNFGTASANCGGGGGDSSSGPPPNGGVPFDKPVYQQPYLKIYNSDIISGGDFLDATSTCNVSNAGAKFLGFNNGPSGNWSGASVMYAATALGVIDGVVSASHLTTAPMVPPKGLTFANTIAGTYGGSSSISNCATNYFIKSQGATFSSSSGININPADKGSQYYRPPVGTKFAINGCSLGNNSQLTLYVDGDVVITCNMRYDTSTNNPAVAFTNGNISSQQRFMVVAQGDIYVDNGVTQLDGIYVAQPSGVPKSGTIYTCTNGSSKFGMGQLYNIASPGSACTSKLTVNGALIAQTIKFLRNQGSLPIALNNGTTSAEPSTSNNIAEAIVYSPDIMLDEATSGSLPSTSGGLYSSITSLPPLF